MNGRTHFVQAPFKQDIASQIVNSKIVNPKDASLSSGAPIEDALKVIDQIGGSACLVLDGHGRLVGTVSDGDIRRGLLRGETLDAPVEKIMHSGPTVAKAGAARAELLDLMQSKGVRTIPLVDDGGKLVAVRTLNELLAAETRPNWVVIMAGGAGRRLRPLTDTLPKPMLEIEGRPILERIVLKLAKQGFHRFYLAVNYLSHIVKQHFEYGARLGVEIRYLDEEGPLGTGGALSLITEKLDEPLVVMNGDVLTNLDFAKLIDYHERVGAGATVGVRSHEFQIPYGVFSTDGDLIKGFTEKPIVTFSINAGIYVLKPSLLAAVPKGKAVDMPDFVQSCLEQGEQISGYQISEAWLDIGEHAELERAKREAAFFL